MAAGVLDKAMAVLQLLVDAPDGLLLGSIAEGADLPKSGAHRLCADLVRLGLVRQEGDGGRYVLSMTLVSMAFQHLARVGVVDAAQPVLDTLASSTGELVRLGIVDGDRQVWVAKAQGARSGLIYDPQMGDVAKLSCMASGHAWLAFVEPDEAVRLVATQGLADPDEYGPNAPRSFEALLAHLRTTAERGYALVVDSSAPGMSAVAAPVLHPVRRTVVGTVSVGGPSVRLPEDRLHGIAPELLEAARLLSDLYAGSTYLRSIGASR
jgi:DNA-binding IclR family transcriptional regulator